MNRKLSKQRTANRFELDQQGAVFAEAAVIMPLLFLAFFAFFQLASALFLQVHITNTARAVARQFAIGALTEAQAEARAQQLLFSWPGATYHVDAIEAPGGVFGDIAVRIDAPVDNLLHRGTAHLMNINQFSTIVVMRRE